MRRQNFNTHFVRNSPADVVTDRTAENAAQMVIVSQQVTAVEITQLRYLLCNFEGRHRAHFEVAALERRNLGPLLKQRRCGMHADGKTDGRAFYIRFELVERLVEEIGRRCGGGDADLYLRLRAGSTG